MSRRNSFRSAVIRFRPAMYSSQSANGSKPAAACHPSKAAVPAAQITGSRSWLRPYRAVGFVLVAILLLVCGSASAQTTGTLVGVVSDQNGSVVPSATVRATNTDTGFTVTVKPSSEGSYLIPLLPLGHYSISAEASGFKTFARSGVLVPVGQNIRVDVTLTVGTVDQTVNVASSAVNIETTNATIGATIDSASLNSLPLNGRNSMGLLQTLPGVSTSNAPTAVTGARGGPSFSISGSRTNAGAMMLDGSIFTDALANTGQQFPSVDALSEFRVLTDSFSAEYGRAAGSVILAVTKSGTNQFHGGAWEYIRNISLEATSAGPSFSLNTTARTAPFSLWLTSTFKSIERTYKFLAR